MTVTGSLPHLILHELAKEESFNDISFVSGFENITKPTPLTTPIVALSIKKCEISEAKENASRDLITTLSADIYISHLKKGYTAHQIFDRLASFLLFTKKFTVINAECEGIRYDTATQAITVHSYFVFTSNVTA